MFCIRQKVIQFKEFLSYYSNFWNINLKRVVLYGIVWFPMGPTNHSVFPIIMITTYCNTKIKMHRLSNKCRLLTTESLKNFNFLICYCYCNQWTNTIININNSGYGVVHFQKRMNSGNSWYNLVYFLI